MQILVLAANTVHFNVRLIPLQLTGLLTLLCSNQWQLTGGPFTFPIHLRITSVLGDSIDDFLTSKSGNMGTAQFPGGVSTRAHCRPWPQLSLAIPLSPPILDRLVKAEKTPGSMLPAQHVQLLEAANNSC